LEVCCGKGTYIRSLARDIGERLGCGALVQQLRRTRIGPFTTDRALMLDADAETGRAHLLPSEMAVAELPRLVLPDNERKRLEQGQAVAVPAQGMTNRTEVAVFGVAGKLSAVAVFDPQRQTLQPVKVLPSTKQ
jgi:tRNA pseudouridine55 synthase